MNDGTCATIPIFPLGDVVLFPKLRVPLYIFESRYRQMTRAALEGDNRIGMVTVKPEHREETAGNPAVFSTGCEGLIVQSESQADGCYNIVLLGARRFRILRELAVEGDRLYRIAEVEFLAEGSAQNRSAVESAVDTEVQPAETRAAITQLLRELLGRTEAESTGSQDGLELLASYDDELFVNSLAQSLSFSASEKQGLIECNGVRDRLRQLLALLQFRQAAIRSGQSGAAPVQ